MKKPDTIWISVKELQRIRRQEGNIDSIKTRGKLTHFLPLGIGYVVLGVPRNALSKKKGKVKLTILNSFLLTMG